MKTQACVLLIMSDSQAAQSLKVQLESLGHKVVIAETGAEGLEFCQWEIPDLVFLNPRLPDMDGRSVLKRIKALTPWIDVVILSVVGTIQTAVKAIKEGADDYLHTPIDSGQLIKIMDRVHIKAGSSKEIRKLRKQYRKLGAFGYIIGRAPSMEKIYGFLEQVSQTDATLLIAGESGTGKELVARTVHGLSPRRKYPFVAVNCAAITSTLWESEFFGHERGSFTGAEEKKFGLFEQSHHGTLFLDEISEIPMGSQAKFLRVLEYQRFRRVGGLEEVQTNVRVVAATNRDILKSIEHGYFRADLYYRLSQLHIELPSLRRRKEDIPILAQAFIADAASRYNKPGLPLSGPAMSILMEYNWPGNIRELKNVIERSVLFVKGSEIGAREIKDCFSNRRGEDQGMISLPVGTPLEEAERVLIQKTLHSTGGNKTKAAKLLGISVKAFYNKLHRYHLMKTGNSVS